MKYLIPAAALAAVLAQPALAAEPESCGTVRFSDVGWTDITATTAAAGTVLRALGYDTNVRLLSVPVTYTELAEGDLDVFLGNWMPTMEADIAPIARRVRWTRCAPTSRAPSTRWRFRRASRTRG
jgi:glycine betaine/proline transport system substrate-binding protein